MSHNTTDTPRNINVMAYYVALEQAREKARQEVRAAYKAHIANKAK